MLINKFDFLRNNLDSSNNNIEKLDSLPSQYL